MANLQTKNAGRDAMALLLDEDGFVTEGTGANFIMVKDGKLIITELRNMLRGSSMMYVKDVLAPQLNLEVIHKNFEPYDVMDCDESMFTGTYVSLLPCNRLDGMYFSENLKKDPFGPVTKRISEAWSENVGVDFVKQRKDWSEGYDKGYIL